MDVQTVLICAIATQYVFIYCQPIYMSVTSGRGLLNLTNHSDGADGLSAYFDDLKEGITYLRGTFVVPMLVGGVIINFTLGATIAVLPSYGARIGGEQECGFLMAAFATGILLGAQAASALDGFALVDCRLGHVWCPVSPDWPLLQSAGCPRLSPCLYLRSSPSVSRAS